MSRTKSIETDLGAAKIRHINESEKISKDAKRDMEKMTQSNDKDILKAKPKLVIRVPKPFTTDYFEIDLSSIIGGLIAGLSAAATSLLMSKLSDLLYKSMESIINKGAEISMDAIKDALHDMDISSIVKDLQKGETHSGITYTVVTIEQPHDDIEDIYASPVNKVNRTKKSKYTIDNRDRVDILQSSKVAERYTSKNEGSSVVINPNYGAYLE